MSVVISASTAVAKEQSYMKYCRSHFDTLFVSLLNFGVMSMASELQVLNVSCHNSSKFACIFGEWLWVGRLWQMHLWDQCPSSANIQTFQWRIQAQFDSYPIIGINSKSPPGGETRTDQTREPNFNATHLKRRVLANGSALQAYGLHANILTILLVGGHYPSKTPTLHHHNSRKKRPNNLKTVEDRQFI